MSEEQLRAGLSELERRLKLACKDEDALTEYALGKIELFNIWAYEENNPIKAILECITYCRTYVKIYEGVR